jgi:hypothetical protein
VRAVIHNSLVILLLTTSAATWGAELVPDADSRPLSLYVLGSSTYDDNLYDLPANVSVNDVGLGPNASRSDWIETGAAGMKGQWQLGYQFFLLSLRADYNKFNHNDALNNVATDNKLQWNWRLGTRLSGKFYGSYNQVLASFANNHFYQKDVLRNAAQYAEIDWQVGFHWILKATGRRATTSHSADALSNDNYLARAATFGIDYYTSSDNTFGWEYRRLHGTFPNQVVTDDSLLDRPYFEDAGNFHLAYLLTAKTSVQGSVGYLRRRYSDTVPGGSSGDFSGGVWRASVQWQPGAKTSIVLSAWRDVTAHVDAQSDYFVTTGTSIAPVWNMTEALSLSLKYSRDREAYLNANPSLIFDDTRHDTANSAQCILSWTPRRAFDMQLAYQYAKRDSTLAAFDYKYDMASIQVRFTL